jgi:hypothetical protein
LSSVGLSGAGDDAVVDALAHRVVHRLADDVEPGDEFAGLDVRGDREADELGGLEEARHSPSPFAASRARAKNVGEITVAPHEHDASRERPTR